jgi:hypothetical protein
MDRTKRVISTIAGFFLLWTLVCLIAAVAVCNIAGDRVLLSGEMLRYAPPQVSGLPEAEYSEMGRMIADYLTGRRQDFQYTYKDEDEKEITCFQPHEAAHMADCRGLIRTAGTLRWILAAAALVFFAVGIFLRESRKKFVAGIVAGFAAVAAVFLAVLLWGLFCLYHRRPTIAGLYGGLAMRDGNIVDAQGCAIKLTPMQQQLMEMFMSAPEYTLTKQQICDALWPKKDDASETLYTLIRRLKPIVEQHSELKIEVDRGRAYSLKTR